jgi:hypothetical protein
MKILLAVYFLHELCVALGAQRKLNLTQRGADRTTTLDPACPRGH